MLKLHQYFFRTSFIFIIISFLFSLWLSYYFVKKVELDSADTTLRKMLVTMGANKSVDIEYLHRVANKTNVRITYIDKQGKVLFDSLYNAAQMDNHLKRPEIIEAKSSQIGSSQRFSNTLKRELFYVAQKVKSGYLRVATSMQSIYETIYSIFTKVALLFIVLFIGIIYFSNRMGRKIAKDSEEIDSALESLLNKEFSIYLGNISCCKEFKQIAKKTEKLAKRLKKREKQKNRYTGRLKEITKRQSDIISAISHEFKNPVAAIVGYSQTLIETPDLDSSLKKKFLSKIEENAEKISSMIDTLALSIRLENNNITLNKTTFNLKDIAQSTKEMLEAKYKNRQIILECQDVYVEADRNMLENVFINLIENALKYSEDEVSILCDNNKVSVVDKGIGIEPGEIEKIKSKFYRVDGISWNNSIGVGLYIVDYILKLHNLELEIKSQDGNGSSFGFSLQGIAI